MFSLNKLRTSIRIADDTFPSIVVYGNCPACGKDITHLVFVYTDQTAREAFVQFWESLEAECRLGTKTRA